MNKQHVGKGRYAREMRQLCAKHPEVNARPKQVWHDEHGNLIAPRKLDEVTA